MLTAAALIRQVRGILCVRGGPAAAEPVEVQCKLKTYATGARPSAATAGTGASIFDTTLGKPLWSDGTDWKDSTGTIA